jgi:hypothetical protein
MAFLVGSNSVVNNSRQLQNIASLDSTSATTVRTATSGMTALSVGCYMPAWNNSTSAVSTNGTTAGSNLYYASSPNLPPFFQTSSGSGTSTLSGTWRCMASVIGQSGGDKVPTLWVRVS